MMTNSEHYTGKHLSIDVLPTDQVHQVEKLNNQLQAQTESSPLPINPNTELIKQLHNRLPITNWAYQLTKQREYEKELKREKQRTTRHQPTINYSTRSKQPSEELEL